MLKPNPVQDAVARSGTAVRPGHQPPLADPFATRKLRRVVVSALHRDQHERHPLAWRHIAIEAFWMWVATRVAMVVFSFATVLISQQSRIGIRGWLHVPLHTVVNSWKQWDAYWYTDIAAKGYWEWKSAAFFPLYPMLIKLSSFVGGHHWLALALIISNLAALGAFIGIALLAAHEQGGVLSSTRAVRVFAAYPLAFFLTAPYTEGLFIGFAAFTLLFMRMGKWRWAAAMAFLAGLTRPTSAALFLPLLWEYGRQHGWWSALATHWRAYRKVGSSALTGTRALAAARVHTSWTAVRERRWADALPWSAVLDLALVLAAIPFAFALFMAYLWYQFGHPLLFLHVQELYWRRYSLPLWQTLQLTYDQVRALPFMSYYQARDMVDYGPIIIFAIITIVMIRRQPFSFTLYMAGLLYLAVANPVLLSPDPDLFISAGRFLLAAIPMFLILGHWTRGRPSLDLLFVSGGFLIQAVLAAYFLSGGWLI